MIESFKNESRRISGTPEREEWEYKIAFENTRSLRPDFFYQKLIKNLERSWKVDRWNFSELVGQYYYSKDSPHTYLYRDIYFDTPQMDLLNNRLSYRLRYRFKSVLSGLIYEYMPFWKEHWPIRCEIQSKNSKNLVSIHRPQIFLETRFEFRNNSLPFSRKKNAPSAPWPLVDFITFAQAGQYKEHLITPMASIIKHLEPKSDLEFNVVLDLKTPRTRWHIELKNPFGSATNNPNPDNVFLISWDEVKDGLPPGVRPFIEVEVEADRSSLDEVQDRRLLTNTRAIEAAIKADQDKLYSLVRLSLEDSGVRILESENKYHRIIKSKYKRR